MDPRSDQFGKLIALCKRVGDYCEGTDGNVSGKIIGDGLYVTRTKSVVKHADLVRIDDPQASSEAGMHAHLLSIANYAAHLHIYAEIPGVLTVCGTGSKLHQDVHDLWRGERLILIRNHTVEAPDAVIVAGRTTDEVIAVIEALSGTQLIF